MPEAQLDRFMFQVNIGYLSEDDELEVVRSTTAIQSLTQHGDARNRESGGARAVLSTLREELAGSSLREDPLTGEFRYAIEAASHGGQRLRYRRVVGAELEGGGLQAIWSQWITCEVGADGAVSRTEGGQPTRVLGRGIESLTFTIHNNRVVEIRCSTAWTDPKTGEIKRTVLTESVTPTQ